MSEDILFVKMRLPWILEIFVMTSRQEVDSIYYSQFKKADYQVITPIACKGTKKKYKFSVIVPFRENPYQNRSQQLKKFIPYMTEYLGQLGENYQFSIIIVEQSADGRKFNRGQLLNIGFQIGRSQGCDYHIFHDVDLLPDQDLLCYYGFCPISPLHLAAHWEKYQFLDLFFGGVCSFVTEQFQKVNGYPNNFWG